MASQLQYDYKCKEYKNTGAVIEIRIADNCQYYQVQSNSVVQTVVVSIQLQGGIETVVARVDNSTGASERLINPGPNVVVRIRNGDANSSTLITLI
jgi:hypothetical protein